MQTGKDENRFIEEGQVSADVHLVKFQSAALLLVG